MGKTVRSGIAHQKRWIVPDVKDIEVIEFEAGMMRAQVIAGSKSHFDAYFDLFSSNLLKPKNDGVFDINKIVKTQLNKFKSGKYIKKITPCKEVDGRIERIADQLLIEGIFELHSIGL